jgi:hypothetical protein
MTTGQTDNSNALFKESLAYAIPPSNSFMLSELMVSMTRATTSNSCKNRPGSGRTTAGEGRFGYQVVLRGCGCAIRADCVVGAERTSSE